MKYAALLLVMLCSQASFARIDANSPVEKGYDSFKYSASKDLPQLPKDVWRGGEETFLRMDNMTALLLAGGASIIIRQNNDHEIADNFDDPSHRILSDTTERSLDFVGGPGFHFGAAGLWYGLAAASKNDPSRERAWTMLTALSITGAATVGLKAIVNDRTPNDKPWAWPSGHTSSSFTVAAVLDEFYGPAVGIPAYAGASLVAYRMVETGDHWTSDIVFGAVLGWVVGHTVAGNHNLEVAGFELTPFIGDSGSQGIALVKQF